MRTSELPRSLFLATLAVAAIGAGSLLASCGGGGSAASVAPTIATAPFPQPAPTTTPTIAPTASPTATAGSEIIIPIPTPAPIICSPSPVTISVGATVTVTCSASDYIGTFTTSIGDPTIANAAPVSAQTNTLFKVTGLSAGTTVLTVSHAHPTTTTTDTITVLP